MVCSKLMPVMHHERESHAPDVASEEQYRRRVVGQVLFLQLYTLSLRPRICSSTSCPPAPCKAACPPIRICICIVLQVLHPTSLQLARPASSSSPHPTRRPTGIPPRANPQIIPVQRNTRQINKNQIESNQIKSKPRHPLPNVPSSSPSFLPH